MYKFKRQYKTKHVLLTATVDVCHLVGGEMYLDNICAHRPRNLLFSIILGNMLIVH